VSQTVPKLPGSPSGPWLFAHRGTSTLAPENTVAAFELAQSHRADVLEVDVRLSRDHQIIVTHDESVNRTSDGTGLVAELSLNELQRLDTGYHFVTAEQTNPWRAAGLTFLTLAQLFQQFPNVGINIDIKDKHTLAAETLARELDRLMDGRWVNVGSFHGDIIRHFRTKAPDISTAASQAEVASLYFNRFLPRQMQNETQNELRGKVLQIPPRWLGMPLNTKHFIRTVRQNDLGIVYWTINRASTISTLLQRGAHGIVSDELAVAREAIDAFNSAAS